MKIPNIIQILQNVRKEALYPKVYSIVMANKMHSSLYSGIHYTLEDAVTEAINDAIVRFPNSTATNWGLAMYKCLTLEELQDKLLSGRMSVVNIQQDKNFLMKKIISEKDERLFKQNKSLFSKEEVKLLEEELKW